MRTGAGRANVRAGGDCAAAPHPQGGTCSPLGIFALTAGRQIARNILRSIEGRPLESYRFTGIGEVAPSFGEAVRQLPGKRESG